MNRRDFVKSGAIITLGTFTAGLPLPEYGPLEESWTLQIHDEGHILLAAVKVGMPTTQVDRLNVTMTWPGGFADSVAEGRAHEAALFDQHGEPMITGIPVYEPYDTRPLPYAIGSGITLDNRNLAHTLTWTITKNTFTGGHGRARSLSLRKARTTRSGLPSGSGR